MSATISTRGLLGLVALGLGFASPTRAVTIDWVTVGNAGNAVDTTGFGSVGYEYRIGKYEVTIGQYAEFLNSKAKSDPYGLYDSSMAADAMSNGITRSGSNGNYVYTVFGPTGVNTGQTAANRPITWVSWWSAARFANWMQNGQGAGSTETGAYNLNSATGGVAPQPNPGALFRLPTESEWYKAAFFSPNLNGGAGGYYLYATQSNVQPGNSIGNFSNQANYVIENSSFRRIMSVTQAEWVSNQNYLTDVGSYVNSPSFYGTFDQDGNAWEWTEWDGNVTSSSRPRRGGSYEMFNAQLSSSPTSRADSLANDVWRGNGFRLAGSIAPVPEPSTCAMALVGIACGGFSMWRRRKRA